ITSAKNVGVLAYAQNGDTTVTTGAIDAQTHGVLALTPGASTISITTGDITAHTGMGVWTSNSSGDITVKTGDVVAGAQGVYVQAPGGSADITTGGVSAYGIAIHATGVNGVKIAAGGAVYSKTSDAINATSGNGPVDITASGGVTSIKGNAVIASGY